MGIRDVAMNVIGPTQILEHVVSLMRSIFAALFAFFLLSNACAYAGDYTVAYAFDAGDVNDAGKMEGCEYEQFCLLKSEKTDLSILLNFRHPDHDDVDIQVSELRDGQLAAISTMATTQ